MEWSAIVAALIGAAIGSLGAQWLGDSQRRRHDTTERKREAAVNHLLPLQDALESLWFRLKSDEPEEAEDRARLYYEESSLYLLANALAQIRLLVVEGAYANLRVFDADLQRAWATRLMWRMMWKTHPDFSYTEHLERALDQAEKAIGAEAGSEVSFYRYQRRALADRMIRLDVRWRVLNYDEFAAMALRPARDGEPADTQLLEPAIAFVRRLAVNQRQQRMIMKALQDALWLIEIGTHVKLPPAIRRAIDDIPTEWPRHDRVEMVDPDVMPMSDLRDWRGSRRSRPPKMVAHKGCTVLLADLVRTPRPEAPRDQLIRELHAVIERFDELLDEEQSFKIETMGDGYLAASGAQGRLSSPAADAATICRLALGMRETVDGTDFKIHIGVSTGPLTAEKVGKKGLAYFLWEDTAKKARDMARAAPDNTIRCTETVYEQVKTGNEFSFEQVPNPDGEVEVSYVLNATL